MTSNILIAIKNLVKSPITSLNEQDSRDNRLHAIGEGLEVYIKDLFANTLTKENEYAKLEQYDKVFSYIGNKTNPPDIILKDGDAIEVKKVQENNLNELQLNSSYPKNKLYSNSSMITESCKNCEKWNIKDIIYIVGNTDNNNLKELWFVYGDCYAANKEIYENTKNKIIRSFQMTPNIEFAETKELGRINNVDPLGITSLRVRGMWIVAHPHKVFNYLPKQKISANFKFYGLITKTKFEQFSQEDRNNLLVLVDNKKFFINDVKIKNPNNPARLISAKFMEFYL